MSLGTCFFAALSLFFAKESIANSTIGGNVMKVPEDMKPFWNWAIEHGAKFANVSLIETGKERGRIILAEQDIKMGDELMFIPESLTIPAERAKINPNISLALKEAERRGVRHRDLKYIALGMFLLIERKNPQSNWKHFIENLPESVDYLPMNFVEISREELKHTSVVRDILFNYNTAMQLFPICRMFGTCSRDEWFWAFNNVRARIWETLGFIPFFDLLNHHFMNNAEFYIDENRNGIAVFATADISAGDEVMYTYGNKKSSSTLFANYGFFLPDNPSKDACIYVSLMDYHPDFSKKAEAVRKLGFWKPADVSINHPDNWYWSDSREAFNSLRFYTQEYKTDPHKGLITNVKLNLEVLVLKEFIDVIHRSLDRMKSSLREDQALLTKFEQQESDVDYRMVNIIKVRIDERSVLLKWKNFALDCIMMLQTKTLIRNSYSSDYLRHIIYPLVKGGEVSI